MMTQESGGLIAAQAELDQRWNAAVELIDSLSHEQFGGLLFARDHLKNGNLIIPLLHVNPMILSQLAALAVDESIVRLMQRKAAEDHG